MSFVRTIVKSTLPPALTIRLRAAFKHHEHERALLPALCDRDRMGVDVGAALGAYTWPLAHLCKDCLAFEPNSTQADYLRRAFGRSVRVESVALSNRSGETELLIPLEGGQEMAGLATIGAGEWFEGKTVRRQRVAMRTLDSYRLDPVGFMKIDVEGHELAVLEGAADLLRRCRPALLIEVEERFAAGSVARVRAFLESLSYRGQFLEARTMRPIEAFDPARHQAIESWGVAGAYINNFVFTSGDGHAERLARLGYSLRT
jgi:FkbM family methyltransferase